MQYIEAKKITIPGKYTFHASGSPEEYLDAIQAHLKDTSSTFTCFHRQIGSVSFIRLSAGEMLLELNTSSQNMLYAELDVKGNAGIVISKVINFLNADIQSNSEANLLEILDPRNNEYCNLTSS